MVDAPAEASAAPCWAEDRSGPSGLWLRRLARGSLMWAMLLLLGMASATSAGANTSMDSRGQRSPDAGGLLQTYSHIFRQVAASDGGRVLGRGAAGNRNTLSALTRLAEDHRRTQRDHDAAAIAGSDARRPLSWRGPAELRSGRWDPKVVAEVQLEPIQAQLAQGAGIDDPLELDPAILALEGDRDYGEYLSSECTSCHRRDGGGDGIPAIVNWPTEQFVIAMQAYKQKTRPNPTMQMMAARLSNEEIAALAAYFATLDQ